MAKPSSDSRSPGRTRRTSSGGNEHEHQAADGYAETVAEHPGSGDADAESDVVLLRDHRPRQQHPSDTEADAQSRGHHQGAGGDVVVDVGLLQVDEEQQRKPKCGNGDDARRADRNRVAATSAASSTPSPSRNGMRELGDRCGNSVLTMFGVRRCSPGDAL